MSVNAEDITKAKIWAERIWADATAPWAERTSQDYSYREYVVEPAVNEASKELNLTPSSKVLEIGCGDGSHLLFWNKLLDNANLDTVQLLGIDLFATQINKARERVKDLKNITVLAGDATSRDTAEIITVQFGNPDVIVAMFLMQDTPDLEGILNMAGACLKGGGHLLTVFVHPGFAYHLCELGYVKKAEDEYLSREHISPSGIVQWRFAGYYPIAQKDASPFYLPYFHRNVEDYLDALCKKKFTIVTRKDLMLSLNIAEKLKEARISPFYEEKYNIYWPLIIKEPSSLMIHARIEKCK
ncbi:MAG: class I SAM-dependent methyltransferase [Methanotrichaceae archaeon]|nr:class I SAM-dependent methyltransferase [Methanotrichaceae archaeon]